MVFYAAYLMVRNSDSRSPVASPLNKQNSINENTPVGHVFICDLFRFITRTVTG